jgi:hypothetical protein
MKPPNRPSGLRNFALCGVEPCRIAGGLRSENRSSTYSPITSRMAAINGAAFSVDSEDNTVAPVNAPIAPGAPNFRTIGQSMFLNRQCDSPEASVVPTSARCTAALAWAAPSPLSTSIVEAVTPNAMPSAPSTSCAPTPTSVKIRSERTGSAAFDYRSRAGDRTGWAGQNRAQHHSSKAISRREGQKGSRAARHDGDVR